LKKDSFLTIDTASSFELKINKSKFISLAIPINESSEVQSSLSSVKKEYYDAAHRPYAYRTGIDQNNYKYSDDGEPSGSAGKPILDAIDKYDLTNLIIIVNRYFGGIKLGVGGLRRAFFEAADMTLSSAIIIEKLITDRVSLEFDYTFMNQIMKLIESEKIKLTENVSEEKCKLILEVRLSKIEKLKRVLISLTNGSILIN